MSDIITNVSDASSSLVHNKLNINPSFREKFPHLTRNLLIGSVVLAALACLALMAFAMVAGFGITIPIATGILAGAFVLFSVVLAACVVKSKRLDKLSKTHDLNASAIRYSLGDATAAWDNYDDVLRDFHDLNLRLQKQELSVLQQDANSEDILGLVENITKDYQKSLEILQQRKDLYSQLKSHSSDRSLFIKNQKIMSLCRQIINNIASHGGIFSLKMRGLSPQMSKISLLCNVVIVITGLTLIGAVLALVPWSLATLPLLMVVVLSAGVCILCISYIIRLILQSSNKNKKQLFDRLAKTVNLSALKDMTKCQQRLFTLLRSSLVVERLALQQEIQSREKVTQLKDELQRLQEQLNELQFSYKHWINRAQQRENALINRHLTFDADADLAFNDSIGFREILRKGVAGAKRRRQEADHLFVADYKTNLSEDDASWGEPWTPKAVRLLEHMKFSPSGLSQTDRLLIGEGISRRITRSRKQLNRIKKIIAANIELLTDLENQKDADHAVVVSDILSLYDELLPESVRLLDQLQDLFPLLGCFEITQEDKQGDDFLL